MKNVSIDGFRDLEKKWYDAMQKPNGLESLANNNQQLFIDGMVSKAVITMELNIDFFLQFREKIGTAEYNNLRTAWKNFRNTIDVSTEPHP